MVLHFNPQLGCQDRRQAWSPWMCHIYFFKGACRVEPVTFLPFYGPELIIPLGPVYPPGNGSVENRMAVNLLQPTIKPPGSDSQWLNQEYCHQCCTLAPFPDMEPSPLAS